MWKLWNKGGSQPFARVSKRVDEHKLLQDWKITERTPRIIGCTQKIMGVRTMLNMRPMCC